MPIRNSTATSPCRHFSLDNYVNAWNRASWRATSSTPFVIVVPAVILVLFLASMLAFAVSRYSWRLNLLC